MVSQDDFAAACAAIEEAIAYCVANGHTIAAAHLQHGLDVLEGAPGRRAPAARVKPSHDPQLPAARPSPARDDDMVEEGKPD